ncbi:hypothetical protein HNQ41_003375 [Texcoconibacillus texcoconensis]|uniref:Uncharacterized protein n=1 Tax=Texcoconibacillus texcoconensis TaxID=1095777 RepID=A0A840QUU8_9BACI|nr:hypothetical protein [Texcoconibacillus texcoconensis]
MIQGGFALDNRVFAIRLLDVTRHSRTINVSKDTPCPNPIHLMTEVTSVLGYIIKNMPERLSGVDLSHLKFTVNRYGILKFLQNLHQI